MIVFKYGLRLFWSYRKAIVLYLVIFVLFSLVNVAKDQQAIEQYSDYKVDIAYIDHSQTELSQQLLVYLGKQNQVQPYRSPNDSTIDIKENTLTGLYKVVIVIPKDLEKRLATGQQAVEVFFNNSYMNSGFQVEAEVNEYLFAAKVLLDNQALDYREIERVLESQVTVELYPTETATNQDQGYSTWLFYYFKFSGYLITAIIIMIVGLVMNEFSEPNVRRRNIVGAISYKKFHAQVYLSQLVVSLVIGAVFAAIPFFIINTSILSNHYWEYVLNMYVYMVAVLCFNFMFNQLTTNRLIVSAGSNALALGLSFISGVMVPKQYLSGSVVLISKFFPLAHFVEGVEKIFATGGIPYQAIGIQLLFGGFFLIAGIYFARLKRVES